MGTFNLTLSDTHEALIGQLIEMCDLKNKRDVIENALTMLGWAAIESAKGHSIAALDSENKVYREIQTPALTTARLKAQFQANEPKQMTSHA